jgi:hypothetical protein
MRRSFDERPETVDNALIGLIQNGIDRYKLNVLAPHQIEDEKVDELMDLASDVLGDRSRNVMLQLPKEKKIQLILQLTVHDIDVDQSRLSTQQRKWKETNLLRRSTQLCYFQSAIRTQVSTGRFRTTNSRSKSLSNDTQRHYSRSQSAVPVSNSHVICVDLGG